MKKFQPATVCEHLQALYVQGHDWALDALEMVEMVDSAYEDSEAISDLRTVFHMDSGSAAEEVAEMAERIFTAAERLVEETTFLGGVPAVPVARLNDLEDVLPKPAPEPPREIIPCHLTTDT